MTRPHPNVKRPLYGSVRPLAGTLDDYLRALESRFDAGSLAGSRVLLDCAHGATYQAAPIMFERLGAEVDVIADEPDGVNINEACGSTHMEAIVERMKAGQYDVGFAFDGDGDRVLAVGRDGTTVDGDEIIAHSALDLQKRGELVGGVAVTVMTNFGFHNAMREAGIEVATTAVGDKHVVEELAERGWILGGEQSGHIVDMRLTPSGDGIAAALLLMRALDGQPLEAGDRDREAPAGLVNVRVADRDGLESAKAVWEAVEKERAAAGGARPRAAAGVGDGAAHPRDGGSADRGGVPSRGRHAGRGRAGGARRLVAVAEAAARCDVRATRSRCGS